MKQQQFSFTKRLRSFKHAFNGLKILLKEEHNARIHVFVAICVLIAGYYFVISTTEWIVVIFAIGMVLTVEIINSSIENVADFISSGKNETIKKVKDLAAAAVLISAFTAFVVGMIVFVPKVIY